MEKADSRADTRAENSSTSLSLSSLAPRSPPGRSFSSQSLAVQRLQDSFLFGEYCLPSPPLKRATDILGPSFHSFQRQGLQQTQTSFLTTSGEASKYFMVEFQAISNPLFCRLD
ncbi:hypothetical protein E2C01_070938 [Portunus trituberculatus]|uniref:Uncharacterized protein n=1 Tax=Portunus trituberculatus TaxID=210409 RepID=A0A5B7HYP5_PORTR|nr:hypothetical protein [Portunus trituberculatus]